MTEDRICQHNIPICLVLSSEENQEATCKSRRIKPKRKLRRQLFAYLYFAKSILAFDQISHSVPEGNVIRILQVWPGLIH